MHRNEPKQDDNSRLKQPPETPHSVEESASPAPEDHHAASPLSVPLQNWRVIEDGEIGVDNGEHPIIDITPTYPGESEIVREPVHNKPILDEPVLDESVVGEQPSSPPEYAPVHGTGTVEYIPPTPPQHQAAPTGLPNGGYVGGGWYEDDRQDNPFAATAIEEHRDDVIVVGISAQPVSVEPGDSAVLTVNLLNNGAVASLFSVNVEGWVDEEWFVDLPMRLQLQPGERANVSLPVSPPRTATSRAGEVPVAIVVRAAAYPERYSRVKGTLLLRPFDAFDVGAPYPRPVSQTWFKRSSTILLPLTNLSNHRTNFRVFGLDRRHQCSFTFMKSDSGIPQLGQAHFTLEPNQTTHIPVQVTADDRPIFGLFPQVVPFYLAVEVDGEEATRQAAGGQISCPPLIGIWHWVALASLLFVLVVGAAFMGLTLLFALRPAATTQPVAPVTQPAPESPVFAILIQVDEPVPTRVSPTLVDGDAPALITPQISVQAEAPPLEGRDATVPMVSSEQVTAPGEAVPPPQTQPPQPVAVNPAPARPEGMTYAQMFQRVALTYDLNWQMLAAQAYVESGFDSLALGSHGDLGLMQIRPSTWQEWAPKVDAVDPFDSYSNVLVGAAYLDYLRTSLGESGHPEQEWMLVAYNWGPDKLRTFLEEGGTWETLDAELQAYALDVLRIAQGIPAN